MKWWYSVLAGWMGVFGFAGENLALDVISYEAFVQEDADALQTLQTALHTKGIVGMRGIPGYRETVQKFIESARAFAALPESVKEAYAPNRSMGEMFLGYEKGKEKFQRPDGTWVIDDSKVSYYGFVPEHMQNKWPAEVDLQRPFQALGTLMSQMGEAVMRKMGLVGSDLSLDGEPRVGRMLHYCNSKESATKNPFWCGPHFDHGMFTALIPAVYFLEGKPVAEPEEAGLFVRLTGA